MFRSVIGEHLGGHPGEAHGRSDVPLRGRENIPDRRKGSDGTDGGGANVKMTLIIGDPRGSMSTSDSPRHIYDGPNEGGRMRCPQDIPR